MGIVDEVSAFHLLPSIVMGHSIGILFELEEGVLHSCKGAADYLEGDWTGSKMW